MFLDRPPVRPLPMVLRLAGLWLLWSAWCSVAGWLLSALHQLNGLGYLAFSPVLVFGGGWWLKATAAETKTSFNFAKIFRRLRRPAPLVFLVIALLGLLGGVLYAPWSFDAASYRLPRILYWWSAGHWHWIDTLDHRLDFSSAGFEWQMLPLLVLAQSDRLLFLLNWLPFLLLPGLTFLAFRALGVNGRSARRWMWLLPAAFCVALQGGSVQNDGYSLGYLFSAIIFLGLAARRQNLNWLLLATLAIALLTGAKVSNLPLLLPLGVLWLAALRQVRWFGWRLAAVLPLALFCSFAPLSYLCWLHTGDWTGDPTDQWNVKTHGPTGGMAANLVLLAKDATQPPLFPGSDRLNAALMGLNESGFADWLRRGHGEFIRVHYGEMVYEGGAGPGFGMAFYVAALLAGMWLVRRKLPAAAWGKNDLSLAERLAPWLAWISYLVFLVKLGSDHSPRIAMPYYPLLLVTLLRWPAAAAWERRPAAGGLAVLAALMVVPVMLLTPARPLLPIQTLAKVSGQPALVKLAEKYSFWAGLRDDLAPLRAKLPADATRLGYGAGFHDTPYGLFPPLGRREIVELGCPEGSATPPPAGLKYAVVTERGIQERYRMSLAAWLERLDGRILFTYPRNVMLDAHSPAQYESWHLVLLNQSKTD